MGAIKDEKVNDFLKELAKLSNKHNIFIGGCGCCGSPFLYDVNDKHVADALNYNDGKYSAED